MERHPEPEFNDSPLEAKAYNQMDNTSTVKALIERAIDLGIRGLVLDIGTGPGDLPVEMCRRHRDVTVIGVDIAFNMLDLAKAKLAEVQFAHRVDFRIADAKELPYPTGYADAVISNTVMHHFEDPRPYLSEAWRVLKPGGLFVIRDLYRPESEQVVRGLVNTHCEQSTPLQRELFAQSLRAAFTASEVTELLDELGMGNLDVKKDSDRHITIQGRKPMWPRD